MFLVSYNKSSNSIPRKSENNSHLLLSLRKKAIESENRLTPIDSSPRASHCLNPSMTTKSKSSPSWMNLLKTLGEGITKYFQNTKHRKCHQSSHHQQVIRTILLTKAWSKSLTLSSTTKPQSQKRPNL